MELTIGLAFIAGLVSFISPCVLPLVPAYIGYMGGRVTNTVATSLRSGEPEGGVSRDHVDTVVHGLFFVAGFTLVFVGVGLLSTAFIQQIGGANINLTTDVIGRIGGVIIIFFGLHFTGILPALLARLRAGEGTLDHIAVTLLLAFLGTLLILWGSSGGIALWSSPLWEAALWLPLVTILLLTMFWLWLLLGGAFTAPGAFWSGTIHTIERALYSDTRPQFAVSKRRGYGGSALMGVVFSAGWTPCIGPVYGAVLTMAANGGNVGQAGVLLTAYSLGLGIPFLLTALMLDNTQKLLRRLQRHMRAVELVTGAFLIFIGITVASGQLQSLSQQFAGQFADFSISLEESVIAFVTGRSGTAEVENRIDAAGTTNVGSEVSNLAPDFSAIADTGDPISLSDLRGQVVLINFWATWCGPCRLEMPEFQRQFIQHRDEDFTIIAVNNQETLDDVVGFREEFGLTFPLVLDESGDIQDQYGIRSYPSTFMVGRDGIIIARHFGPLTSEQIVALLDQALAS